MLIVTITGAVAAEVVIHVAYANMSVLIFSGG